MDLQFIREQLYRRYIEPTKKKRRKYIGVEFEMPIVNLSDQADTPMYFHHYPEYGMFSSASQVQLDVEYDKLILILNTLSKLEPIKAILFSNSVMLGEDEDNLCCRDMFW